MTNTYDTDILIIGGGINGVGIARDAAGRGLRVTLCEKGDLAGATSSASTKLIHGGLRYLEHYEFGLVRAALMEREVLMAAAPHIISPLRFILPQSPGGRPAWLIRLGLFLYDHLGGREKLPASGSVDLKSSLYGATLKPDITSAAYYYDCWVDDARLVVLNALDAQERGASILTRTECVKAAPQPKTKGWTVSLKDHRSGGSLQMTAGLVVNAAGPWASQCLETVIDDVEAHSTRLVRGSHIVVPKLFDHDNAYIFQNPDERIVFAIPYESDYSLVGTTDDDFTGDLDNFRASTRELDYICETANRFFTKQIGRHDIIWSYAGVRPLLGGERDAKKVSRDYQLDVQQTACGATALSVLGGKITTYRKLAEQATDQIMKLTGRSTGAWTARVSLPGGDIDGCDLQRFMADAEAKYHFLDPALLKRYALAYGTRMDTMLDGVRSEAGLGAKLCPGLHECEANYLVQHEWAYTAEDILWRRTKLGLKATSDNVASLERWVDRIAA